MQVIVKEQGLDTLDKIQLLTDDKMVNLCKVINRPGGKIPGANPGDPPVNNPGTPVNLRAENHFKLLAFCYLRHMKRISRVVNVANVTHSNPFAHYANSVILKRGPTTKHLMTHQQ